MVVADFLKVVKQSRLGGPEPPRRAAEQAEIVAFRSEEDAAEHVALLIGAPDGRPPLVRLHSECLTGDVLGSERCDCGRQLREAVERIDEAGGYLLYLRQEGRGIGLGNKIRAYALQAEGHDTYEANRLLGFPDDLRRYDIAAEMLHLLGVKTVELITNTPLKLTALVDAGIPVRRRVTLPSPANPHNIGYLEAKRARTGHLIEIERSEDEPAAKAG